MINFGRDMRYMLETHKLLQVVFAVLVDKSDTVVIEEHVRRL